MKILDFENWPSSCESTNLQLVLVCCYSPKCLQLRSLPTQRPLQVTLSTFSSSGVLAHNCLSINSCLSSITHTSGFSVGDNETTKRGLSSFCGASAKLSSNSARLINPSIVVHRSSVQCTQPDYGELLCPTSYSFEFAKLIVCCLRPHFVDREQVAIFKYWKLNEEMKGVLRLVCCNQIERVRKTPPAE